MTSKQSRELKQNKVAEKKFQDILRRALEKVTSEESETLDSGNNIEKEARKKGRS